MRNSADWAEKEVGFIAIVGISVCLLGMALRRFGNAPKAAEPWSEEVSAALDAEDAEPLCIHCLTPHHEDDHFCAKCGGPVGAFTNYMPPEYYISMGHVLRIGSGGNFKRSPVMILGFFVTGLVYYGIFAPVYWWRVFDNIIRQQETAQFNIGPVDARE